MLSQEESDGFQLQLEAFQASDQSRQDVLKRLLQEYQDVREESQRLQGDLDVQVRARRELQAKVQAQEQDPFILILVDGDHYIFNDKFLQNGTEGGIEAARILLESVKGYFQGLDDGINTVYAGASQWRVMVRVYANFAGLSTVLIRVGIHKSFKDLTGFTSGFTCGQPLFDFVDVGAEKEGADHKIRSMFDLFIGSCQSKHIIFAGCHDHGYISLLTPHKKDDHRITLLKATSCSKRFLALGFRTVEFRNVFKAENLPKDSPLRAADIPRLSATFSNPNGTPPSSDSNVEMTVRPHNVFERAIYLNKMEERIDPLLPKASEKSELRHRRRISKKKFCHNFQLLGRCSSIVCQFDHAYADIELKLILKQLARRNVCKEGKRCRSYDCYYGHMCPRQGCTGGSGCKFGLLHNLDVEVVRILKQGSQD